MSKYYRGSLPDGEDDRLQALTLKILQLLRIGPITNKYFAGNVCLDYRKRINELRREYGYHIKATRLKGQKGLFEYKLLDEPEPEWEVVVKTIVPDGQFLVYPIIVNALTATEARNNAPRKYVRNEILSVHKKGDPGAPVLFTPPKSGLRAENNMLRLKVQKLQQMLAKVHKRWKAARTR